MIDLSVLLARLEHAGYAEWRLTKSNAFHQYVLSARRISRQGVRWTRAVGVTPEQAAERLVDKVTE